MKNVIKIRSENLNYYLNFVILSNNWIFYQIDIPNLINFFIEVAL